MEKFYNSKVGFSKFCSLRPKWCKTIGSSGSHFVCVCAICQNTILACCTLNLDFKDLINKVVCSSTNKLCMVHCCPNCPGKDNLIEYFYQITSDNTEDEIDFQKWESTNRTTIVNKVMEKFEFVEFLAKKIDLLTAHLYIAKSQARYLSVLKENLLSSTCRVLADFAKKFFMVIQDAVQGWHWTKQQCTIHPLVLYYKTAQEKLAIQLMVFFQMIWNTTMDLCINYKNCYAIIFGCRTLVLVIFSISLMVVWLNTKTTKIF